MTYAEIIERLEKATGPDRKIDVMIASITDAYCAGLMMDVKAALDALGLDEMAKDADNVHSILNTNLSRYTASLDACIALCERVLPGANVMFGNMHAHKPWARVSDYHAHEHVGKSSSLPLAFLIAIFRALEAQEPPQ